MQINSRQSSGLSPVVPFVPFGCSSRLAAEKAAALRSTDHFTAQKKEQLENKQLFFLRCLFLVFTRSLPAFVGATASTIPLHSVFAPQATRNSIPAVLCLPPLIFWRLLLRTAIGVGATPYICIVQYHPIIS